jgi:hypothetical protein
MNFGARLNGTGRVSAIFLAVFIKKIGVGGAAIFALPFVHPFRDGHFILHVVLIFFIFTFIFIPLGLARL